MDSPGTCQLGSPSARKLPTAYIISNICPSCPSDRFVDIRITLLLTLSGCFTATPVYFNEIISPVFEEGLAVYIVVFPKSYTDTECICVIDGATSVAARIRILLNEYSRTGLSSHSGIFSYWQKDVLPNFVLQSIRRLCSHIHSLHPSDPG